MKRNFVLLIAFSINVVMTGCTPYANSPTVTPTFTSTVALSSTPTATNTYTPTNTQIIETKVPIPTTAELPIGDGGLLSGKPCEFPCFFGVRLGETKYDEIIPTLKANGLSPCFKDLKSLSSNRDSVICIIDKLRVRVEISEDSRIVNGIWYLPSAKISVGDIIAKYGEPSYVQALYARDDSGNWLIKGSLYWDSLALEVDLSPIKDTEDHKYQIESTTNADLVIFWEEKDYMIFSRQGSEAWRGYDFYSKPLLLP